MDRKASGIEAYRAAVEAVRRGEIVVVYPEGGFANESDGWPRAARTGITRIALETGAPVVPVGLAGTPDIQPIGSNRPRIAHATIRFGEPLHFAERYADVPAGKARRQVTDEIMDAIHGLTGQELAGDYNEHPPAS